MCVCVRFDSWQNQGCFLHHHLETSSKANPFSYTMDTRCFLLKIKCHCMMLITHIQLGLRLKVHGTIPQFPLYAYVCGTYIITFDYRILISLLTFFLIEGPYITRYLRNNATSWILFNLSSFLNCITKLKVLSSFWNSEWVLNAIISIVIRWSEKETKSGWKQNDVLTNSRNPRKKSKTKTGRKLQRSA